MLKLPLLATCLLFAAGALANSERFTATDPTWKAECGSCHIAYPPQLLPAASWHAMVQGLDQHFGADASVDANAAAKIGAFLEHNAGRGRKTSGAPTLRITETGWFRHEHDEVPASVWNSPKVKTPSNCAACHTQAEQGDFSERTLRVPK